MPVSRLVILEIKPQKKPNSTYDALNGSFVSWKAFNHWNKQAQLTGKNNKDLQTLLHPVYPVPITPKASRDNPLNEKVGFATS